MKKTFKIFFNKILLMFEKAVYTYKTKQKLKF